MTTITTRAGKGSNLTSDELDANFNNLNTDKLETAGGTLTGNVTFSTAGTGIVFSDATSITSADGLGGDATRTVIYGKATETISKGSVVMFAGAQGDHVLLALADTTATGFIDDWIVGVCEENLTSGDFTNVIAFGNIEGLDTDTPGWDAGTLLYLDPDTPGALTATAPTSPDHTVLIAAVTQRHQSQGNIIVRPSLGEHLGELHDVLITTPADQDHLVWDNAESVWKNQQLDISLDTTPTLGGTLNADSNDVVSLNAVAIGQATTSNIQASGIEVDAGSTSNTAWYCAAGLMRHFGSAFLGSSSFYNAFAAMGIISHTRTTDRLWANSSTMSGGTLDEWNTLNRITIDGHHVAAYSLTLNNNKSVRFYARNTGIYTSFTQSTSGSPGNQIISRGAWREYEFYFIQDGSGGRTITWQTWNGSTATNLSPIEFGTQDTSPNAVNYARIRLELTGSGTTPTAMFVHWENA